MAGKSDSQKRMIGTKIDHYEIQERIGGGGMGVVYKARDARLGRLVALKFLPAHLDRDELSRERFMREARAASALDHANICTVHDIGETKEGALYIAMGYYQGETLGDRLANGPLPVVEAIRVTRQLAAGLARAHHEGIVHRDIKPANIMVTDRGEVKILDFGLAALTGEGHLTRTGTTMGTVPYMSPEQVNGEKTNHLTDLWSLGVVLYEMLAGRRPFAGESEMAVYTGILESVPELPSVGREDVPVALDSLVIRLMAKDCSARIQSADHLLQLLNRLESGDVSHHATEALATLRPPRRGRPRWVPFIAAGALLTIGAIAAALWIGRAETSHRAQSIAVMPFENLTGDPEADAIGDGIAFGLITRLSELRDLQVVARSEAWRYRDAGLGPGQLGDALGVSVLLEGGLVQQQDGLTVTASLVDTRHGRVLWSEEFAAEDEEPFALQQRIAGRLVRMLAISMSPRERVRLARDPTTSFKAYEAYLEAQRLLEHADDTSGTGPAIEMFRRAIRIDPEFALAHVGLSGALWEQARHAGDSEALAAAEVSARSALTLDPELPAAQVALARVLRDTGNYSASIAELEAVLAEHPNPDEAHRELAAGYTRVGDLDGAERSLRSATVLAPENWRNWSELGGFLWKRGRYEDARQAFTRAAKVAPEHVSLPRENLAAIEISRGNFDAAVAAYERIASPIRSANLASNIGTAYYFSSHRDKWQLAEQYYMLAVRLNPRSDEIQRNLADLHHHLGREEEARIHYLEAQAIVEEKLSSDPENHDLLLRRAFYAARGNDCVSASAWTDRIAADLPSTAENARRLAYVYALCGRRRPALEAVRMAIELGVPGKMLAEEDELSSLRGDPLFEELVGGEK